MFADLPDSESVVACLGWLRNIWPVYRYVIGIAADQCNKCICPVENLIRGNMVYVMGMNNYLGGWLLEASGGIMCPRNDFGGEELP